MLHKIISGILCLIKFQYNKTYKAVVVLWLVHNTIDIRMYVQNGMETDHVCK